MSNLDDVKVSECEACNIRSEKVNSDNPYVSMFGILSLKMMA